MFPVKSVSIYCVLSAMTFCCGKMTDLNFGEALLLHIMNIAVDYGGTAAAVPPPFRPSEPAFCGSCPLVTPYYCRLGVLPCLFV